MSLFPKERDLTRPAESVELVVDASDFGMRVADVAMRLDAFLVHHLTWRSRSSIQDLVKEGWVSVDASSPEAPTGTGSYAVERRPGRKLRHGSRVRIDIPPHLRPPVDEHTSTELVVLYEDDAVLAVDKPPFLPVHPSGRHLVDTLIQRVHARTPAGEIERRGAPRLCHRLDRETSGVVLVAKDPEAHRELRRQFEAGTVEKEYLAIVHGVPARDQGVIEFPIGPARLSEVDLKMAACADGLPARTDWRIVSAWSDRALLSCLLHTGRQHQIRVHLEAIGHPLVGDKLYGGDESFFLRHAAGVLDERDLELLELPRHALHDHRLAAVHPVTGRRLEVFSPLAEDLVDYLRERFGVEPPRSSA